MRNARFILPALAVTAFASLGAIAIAKPSLFWPEPPAGIQCPGCSSTVVNYYSNVYSADSLTDKVKNPGPNPLNCKAMGKKYLIELRTWTFDCPPYVKPACDHVVIACTDNVIYEPSCPTCTTGPAG